MKSMLFRCVAILALLLACLSISAATAETRRGWCGKYTYAYTVYDSDGNPYTEMRNDHVQWELTDGHLTIWGSEEMMDIPRGLWEDVQSVTIENGVTSIGACAFSFCQQLTSVSIPSSVKEIGVHAFWDCEALTSVTIPDSVTRVGEMCFEGCTGLTSAVVHWPTVERGTFNGCSNLKSVSVGNGVTSIHEDVFRYCTSLESIDIPANVLSIGECAFYDCENLTSIRLHEGLKSIGRSAFGQCSRLSCLVIPDSVQYIGECSLACCTGLTSLTIPFIGSNREEDGFYSLWSLYGSGSPGCEALRELIITNTDHIPDGAIGTWDCENLSRIVLPDTVKTIGKRAFANLPALTEIVLPDAVEEIDDSVFEGCTALSEIVIPPHVKRIGGWVFSGCTALTSFDIPASVESLGSYLFNQTGIRSLIIPNTVKEISENVLSGCDSLENLTIPLYQSLGYYGCTWSLTNVKVTDVDMLPENAFSQYSLLTTIELPETLTAIGSFAFDGCRSLTSVNVPRGVTQIEYGTFYDMDNLQTIILPDTVTTLKSGSISGCPSMENLVLPDSVRTIEGDAIQSSLNITITCSHYSVADRYANETGRSACYTDAAPETLVSLRLPADLTAIEAEAFLGTAATGAEINADCVVGDRAFADSAALRALFVTDMAVSLPADVLAGSENACVYCYPDSQVAADCEAYGIPCKFLF